MKFSNILVGLVASLVSANVPVSDDIDGGQVLNFEVKYLIEEFPEVTSTDVAELTNGQSIHLKYTAVNHEDYAISIVGIGGSFRDPNTNEISHNLTNGQIGPITLGPGDSESFSQVLPLNVQPKNYVLAPQLFIAVNEELRVVPVRGQLAIVTDKALSIFNPQLLFLELVLLVSFAAVAYIAYEIWGRKYIQGTSPVAGKKKVVVPIEVNEPASGKSYNSEWLPQGHLKQQKKKN